MRNKIVLLTFFSGMTALILAQQAAQTQPATPAPGGTPPSPTAPGSMPPGPPPANAIPPAAAPATPNNVVHTQNISTQNISGETFSTNLMPNGTNFGTNFGMGTNSGMNTNFETGGMSVSNRSRGMGFGASTNQPGMSVPWKGPRR